MNVEACAAQHYGLWAVNWDFINATVSAYNAGRLPKVQRTGMPEAEASLARAGKHEEGKIVFHGVDGMGNPRPLYAVDPNGITRISVNDTILKGESSFGGTSSVRMKYALRRASQDEDVKGILNAIDSPGGTVDGLKPFADELFRIRQEGKIPVHTHGEDNMHSAALWFGVQSQFVSASEMTEVGSIGVVAIIQDTSKMAEDMGVKVHRITSGGIKGAFAPGTEVTEEEIDSVQQRVSQVNDFFLAAVKRGRGLPIDTVRAMNDGRDWLAAEAKEKGLIDAVMSEDDAYAYLLREVRSRGSRRDQQSATRRNRARIANLS